MVVKKVAAADAKVAPGFEGGEPLTLSNSRGLKSALKFFVKIGLFLEFRRIPGKLGDGDGADAKRARLALLAVNTAASVRARAPKAQPAKTLLYAGGGY